MICVMAPARGVISTAWHRRHRALVPSGTSPNRCSVSQVGQATMSVVSITSSRPGCHPIYVAQNKNAPPEPASAVRVERCCIRTSSERHLGVFTRFGDDLLSHDLSRSTIGAKALNFRVRDGSGCFALAMITKPRKYPFFGALTAYAAITPVLSKSSFL